MSNWPRSVRRVLLAASLGLSLAHAADFSRTLSPAEFTGAGLDKLAPAELAQLDALVRQHAQSSAAWRDAAANEPPGAEAARPGLLRRMRVVLTPGTEIAYRAVETEITRGFRGYEPGQVLTLANGQRWRVVDGRFWAPEKDADKRRKVVIEPGALGSFFLDIEGGGRPKVKFVGPVE